MSCSNELRSAGGDRQQAGTLTESDRPELQSLMQIYQEGMVRKAAAQVEAVKRGLIEP